MTNQPQCIGGRCLESVSVRLGVCAPLLLLVCRVAWASAGLGPTSSAHFAVDPPWTPEKGLPGNSVISLVQTRDGYLWLGTGYGLARFDGLHFETFDENNTPGLTSSRIVKLFEDSAGNLWIGTESAGVLKVDTQGAITNVFKTDRAQAGPLKTICEDTSGAVWLYTANGVVSRYRQGSVDLTIRNCAGLTTDSSGFIWIGRQDERLAGCPVPTNAPSAIFVAYELPVGKIDFLLPATGGGYWRLAGGKVQKCRLDKIERDCGAYPWDPARTPVVTACEDRTGNLIVGTYGDGVYWLNESNKFIHLTSAQGLLSTYIFSTCLDREGSLWLGTDGGGLERVKQPLFDVAEGSRGLAVQSVCEDNEGGIWFGINNGGVDYWKDGVLREYKEKEGLTDLYVHSVFVLQNGEVWAGTTRGGGLFQLRTNMFQPVPGWWPFVSFVRGENGLFQPVFPRVQAIYQDKQGAVWVGTDQGLASWDGSSWKVFTKRDGLSDNLVQALIGDSAGDLWVGTASGMNRFRSGRFESFHKPEGPPADDIASLYLDAQNVLWVGTSGGLGRFDGRKWAHFTKQDGLISNRIGYLIGDAQESLWLGSPAGLMRLRTSELGQMAESGKGGLSCRPYRAADGLPTAECSAGSQPAACAARDGTLWFPTIRGLASIRPEQIRINSNPPPVRIESIKVQGQPQQTNALYAVPLREVTIPPFKTGLEIDCASLNLTAPDLALFKFRMQIAGRQEPWSEPAAVRVAQYPKLPPGKYVFQVTACNEDRVWNQTGASLAVTVLPPFWKTAWFISLVSACALGLIIGLVYYVSTQRLQRQVASLKQQEALEHERARIARDLHDQLGANLTQVSLLSEMIETDKEQPAEVESHARQISTTARETTHALDEIVWTVNPSNDTLDGLINYVCKYAQEYLAIAGLRYRLEVPAQLPALQISPELRHNVFLAAKEAVNNVVKHAHASSAWLRLHLESQRFILEIEDNGRGLASGADKKGRSGLRNMRKRMEDVGGEFEAVPGAEGGTRVRLIAPLQAAS